MKSLTHHFQELRNVMEEVSRKQSTREETDKPKNKRSYEETLKCLQNATHVILPFLPLFIFSFLFKSNRHLHWLVTLPLYPSLCVMIGFIVFLSKVVVLSGAGISVNCGIPDFRSPGGPLLSPMTFFSILLLILNILF